MQRGIGQRGAVMPLVAICLAVLMGFAGMAVDVGFMEYKQQVQQSATDSAAIGAAEASYEQGCQSASFAQNAAISDATLNGFTTGGNVTVSATADPATGPYAGNPCAVAVKIKTTSVQTFFTHVLGIFGMDESTQAVGLASQNNPGCLWLLSTTEGQSNLSNTTINTPGCYIYMNTSANMSNSTINAGYIGYASGTNNTSGTTFGSAQPASMNPVADPCPQMPGCAYLTSHSPATTSVCNAGNFSGNATIGAAGTTTCYSSLNISGTGNVVCGLIEVNGSQFHLNNSTTTSCSSGVTFALGALTSDINLSNATLTLSAPTTGNTRGVVLWRDSSQSNAVNLSNCSCAMTGLMYFPTAQVTYSSAAASYTVMVFGQANFSTSGLSGTTGLSLASPPPNGTVGLKAVLAQ